MIVLGDVRHDCLDITGLVNDLDGDSLRLRRYFLLRREETVVNQIGVVHGSRINMHLLPRYFFLVVALLLSILLCHHIEEFKEIFLLLKWINVLVKAWEGHVMSLRITWADFLFAMVQIRA